MLEQFIYVIAITITVAIPVVYMAKSRNNEKTARAKLDKAVTLGLTEPVSLHPKIDVNRCIGAAACVAACPEGKILGIIRGRAELISPSRCIGHGACQTTCPVDAISLVFGTERRGVDIPHLQETFETNVEGIYIAGELGGMGLIRNAVTQGKEAMQHIARGLTRRHASVLDVAIIGAGPAGLSASLQAKAEKLRYVTLEQEDFGGAILTYPRQKIVMTQPMDVPLYGKTKFREIRKEELLQFWQDIIEKTDVRINTHEKLEDIQRVNGHFRVVSAKGEYFAQRVLLAIGRRGAPRKLDVPGEKSSKVAYKMLDPEQYKNRKLLVVGGGDSAVEAALALSEQKGTDVVLSYRQSGFSRLKEKNLERIEEAKRLGWMHVLFESNVREIQLDRVLLEYRGGLYWLENDYVFVMIGGELPTAFLQKLGVHIEKKFGER